jgi:integrase
MPVRKVGTRWLVDIRYNGSRCRVRSPGVTKADAEAHETYLRGQLALHGIAGLQRAKAAPPTLAQFAATWMRDYVTVNNKPSEQRMKEVVLRTVILPLLGRRALPDISAHDAERLKRRGLQRGLSPKTINNQLTVLRRLLRSAFEWGALAAIPQFRLLAAPTPPFRYLSMVDIARLANSAPNSLARAMIVTASHTGLRVGELAGLEWDDVDFARHQLRIARNLVRGHLGTPKNGRTRYVPLTPEIAQELHRLPRAGRAVFVFRGHRMSSVTALSWLRRACDAVGIERIGWHVLRHSYASELTSRGVPLAVTRELLGHQTIEMTLRYAHLAPGVGHEAVRVLSLPGYESGHAVGTPPIARNVLPQSSATELSSLFAQQKQNRVLSDAA